MEITPFVSEHLLELPDFGQQDSIVRHFLEDLMKNRYEDQGPAFTGRASGEIIGCAGLVEMTKYRAYTWAIVPTQTAKARFVPFHRAVRKFLSEQTYKRIDAQVAFHDTAGHRWAKMLGFRVEIMCRPWAMPDGSSLTEYVRFG